MKLDFNKIKEEKKPTVDSPDIPETPEEVPQLPEVEAVESDKPGLEARGTFDEGLDDTVEAIEDEGEYEESGFKSKLKGLFGSKEDDPAEMTFADKHTKARKKRIKNVVIYSVIAAMIFGAGATMLAQSGILEKKEQPAQKVESPKQDDQAQMDEDKSKQEAEEKAKKEAEDKAKQEEQTKADEKAKREAEDKADADKKTDEQIKQEVDKKVQEGLERATKSVVEEYNKKLEDANKKVESINKDYNSLKSERDQLRAQLETARQNAQNSKSSERIEIPGE